MSAARAPWGWLLLLVWLAGAVLTFLLVPIETVEPWLSSWLGERGQGSHELGQMLTQILLPALAGLGLVLVVLLAARLTRRGRRPRQSRDPLEQWLNQLQDPDPARWHDAVEALSERLEERALQALVAALSDPRLDRVQAAAAALHQAISRLAKQPDGASLSLQVRVVNLLLNARSNLPDSAPAPQVLEDLLATAAQGLGCRQSDAVIEPLITIVKGAGGRAREEAALALYRLGRDATVDLEAVFSGR